MNDSKTILSFHDFIYLIKVITKLPNSEQSYKGKVKTHKYINRQNQSTTGKLTTLPINECQNKDETNMTNTNVYLTSLSLVLL
jgi:hypothetical protein